MTAAVKTTTTELPDSRVRVEVEVPTEALERELKTAASQLGREMRVPGFRSGKVPPEVVLQQVGREAVLDEAVRRGLPGWYEEASPRRHPDGGRPQVDLNDRGKAQAGVHLEVGVVPPAGSAVQGVEVGRRERRSPTRRFRQSSKRIRESLASLENVEREAGRWRLRRLEYVGSIAGLLRGRRGAAGGSGVGSGRRSRASRRTSARPGRGAHVESLPDDFQRIAGGQGRLLRRGVEGVRRSACGAGLDFGSRPAATTRWTDARGDRSRVGRRGARYRGRVPRGGVDAAWTGQIEVPHERCTRRHRMWHRTSTRPPRRDHPQQYLDTGKKEEEPWSIRVRCRDRPEVGGLLAAIVQARALGHGRGIETERAHRAARRDRQAEKRDLARALTGRGQACARTREAQGRELVVEKRDDDRVDGPRTPRSGPPPARSSGRQRARLTGR